MKKALAMMVCLALLFVNTTTGFAVELSASPDMYSGGMEATPEEIAAADPYNPQISIAARAGGKGRATWYAVGLQYFPQEENMSCGPACVRMLLKHFTGRTYLESTIRNNTNYSDSTGTSMSNLVNYLEDEQSKHNYTIYYGSSISYIMDGFLVGIRDKDAPSICGLRLQKAYGFPYNGNGGHFVVVHQVAADQSAVELFDPWAGYVNSEQGKYYDSENVTYEVTAQNLYRAYCLVRLGVAF